MMSISNVKEGSSSINAMKMMSYVCTTKCGTSSRLLVLLRLHYDVKFVFLVSLVHRL